MLFLGERQSRGAERKTPAPDVFGMESGRYGIRVDLLNHSADPLPHCQVGEDIYDAALIGEREILQYSHVLQQAVVHHILRDGLFYSCVQKMGNKRNNACWDNQQMPASRLTKRLAKVLGAAGTTWRKLSAKAASS